MPVLSTLDTHGVQLWLLHGVFEHPVNFQWSGRLGGTAGNKQQEFQTRFHVLVVVMPLFSPLWMAEPWAGCTSWAADEFLHNQHIDTGSEKQAQCW